MTTAVSLPELGNHFRCLRGSFPIPHRCRVSWLRVTVSRKEPQTPFVYPCAMDPHDPVLFGKQGCQMVGVPQTVVIAWRIYYWSLWDLAPSCVFAPCMNFKLFWVLHFTGNFRPHGRIKSGQVGSVWTLTSYQSSLAVWHNSSIGLLFVRQFIKCILILTLCRGMKTGTRE